MTNTLKKILMGLAALAALALGGSALAGATSGGGGDRAVQERSEASEPEDGVEEGDGKVSADVAARAGEAALAETGGKVNAVERDGEKGATYEVEVTRPDGEQADVRLDERFKVVAVEADDE